jgi:hypothetical protein
MSRDSALHVGQRVSWMEAGLRRVGRVEEVRRGDPPSATAVTPGGKRTFLPDSCFETWHEGWLPLYR